MGAVDDLMKKYDTEEKNTKQNEDFVKVLKKDDKLLIVESQLVESKVYHALENLPKAKASLTAVKTTANSIYIVPML